MNHYVGTILEGRWKVLKCKDHHTYILENIYNHQKIELSSVQIKNVYEEKNTIGHIIQHRISGKFTKQQRSNMKFKISKEQGYIQ